MTLGREAVLRTPSRLESAGDFERGPPSVVGVMDDRHVQRSPDQLALSRMTAGRVTDLLGQSNREADVRAVLRVTDGGEARNRGIGLPAILILRIELEGLSDVVAERAGDQHVAVDGQVGELALERIAERDGQPRHAADVIRLRTRFERRRIRISGGTDLVDGGEAALAEAVGPCVDDLFAEGRVADLPELRERTDDRLAQGFRDFHGSSSHG